MSELSVTSQPSAAPDARGLGPTACDHCGEPVPGGATGAGPHFCCLGCEAVYHAIHGAGLENFYRLRAIGQTGAGSGRVGDERAGGGDDAGFGRFDTPEFLERHTTVDDDGVRQTDLYLEGVHCAGCVWLTERLPHVNAGVVESRLDLSRARLRVRWVPGRTELSDVVRWLSRFGYTAHALREERVAGRTSAERAMLLRVGVCWAIAMNVMLLAIAMYSGLDMLHDPKLATFARAVSLLLATISLVYGGSVFFRRAFTSLRAAFAPRRAPIPADDLSDADAALLAEASARTDAGRPAARFLQLSMDVPLSLGIFVGWLHSAVATFTGVGEVWFDSISVLIAAVLTARWLRMRGSRFAADATERLLSLLPSTARRLRTVDDRIVAEDVPSETLEAGDLIEVRTGEVVPADGIIVSGASSVHRGVVTGESRPEPVAAGEAIEAGVTNLGSPLQVQVTAAGRETRVGKLVQWVEEHAERRAPVVQFADRIGGIFVLVVLAASAVTGLAWSFVDPWLAVEHVVALLVISCPCALGMATPLALTVGVGKAAGRGIYIKHDDVIQSLDRATHVIFDKTGTLTEGRMGVVEVDGSADALRLAARLEAHSNHPIAAAIVARASALPGGHTARGSGRADISGTASVVQNLREIPGCGMEGDVDGRRVRVGQLAWILEDPGEPVSDVDDTDAWRARVARIAGEGHTPVVVAVDGRIAAVLAIGDRIRPEAAELIARLEARGVRAGLLSGDHPEVVARCAEQLGIDPALVQGGVSPEDKTRFVRALKATDAEAIVVMVGDGVNDAAALQAADVGVAVHGGSEAALVAADIFLTREGIGAVWELVEGTRHVMRVVRRNLAGSALYNALGISLAAMGFVAPLVGAILMPFSSLGVVISSLVQRSFRAPDEPAPDTPDGTRTTAVAKKARVSRVVDDATPVRSDC